MTEASVLWLVSLNATPSEIIRDHNLLPTESRNW